MVKELTPIPDVAGLSKIPVAARKHRIRLVENVSEANFIQAIKVTESCAPFPEIKHDVAFRALVEHQGYTQRTIEIAAPLRNSLDNLEGEYYIDNEKILSYKKIKVEDIAGFLDLPEEVRGMQLVLHTKPLIVRGEDAEEEIVDLIAIKKEEQPALESQFKIGEWAPIKK